VADRYWIEVGGSGTGNWSDTDHWSASSGGAGGASKPTSSDNVYFDANSFASGTGTVTVDETSYALSMDWTGATNTPTISGAAQVSIYGDLTLIEDMLWSTTNNVNVTGSGTVSWTFAGQTLPYLVSSSFTGKLTFVDALTLSAYMSWNSGELDTNGQVLILTGFRLLTTGVKTITLGNSTINCTYIENTASGAGVPTFTANTATINISGTGAVSLGDVDWNGASFNLTGTAHTVSGSPTGIDEFNFVPTGGTQTATISAGADISAVTMTETGTVTIQSSVAGELYTLRGSTSAAITGATMSDYILADGDEVTVDCSGATGGTFAGADGTYTSMTVAGAGNYALTVTGNNVFNTFTVDRSVAAKSLVLTGTIQTVTNFLCPVSTTNTLTITGGTITKAGGGQIALDYLVLDTSTVTPAATWYAGEHSYISGGTVIGWIFGDPSGGGTRSLMPAIII
jgi:hypothetical protein